MQFAVQRTLFLRKFFLAEKKEKKSGHARTEEIVFGWSSCPSPANATTLLVFYLALFTHLAFRPSQLSAFLHSETVFYALPKATSDVTLHQLSNGIYAGRPRKRDHERWRRRGTTEHYTWTRLSCFNLRIHFRHLRCAFDRRRK